MPVLSSPYAIAMFLAAPEAVDPALKGASVEKLVADLAAEGVAGRDGGPLSALFCGIVASFRDLRIEREGGKIEDAFQLHLYYPGFKVILKSSYLVREAGPRYKVLGEQGSFYKWGLDPQEEALIQGLDNRIRWSWKDNFTETNSTQ